MGSVLESPCRYLSLHALALGRGLATTVDGRAAREARLEIGPTRRPPNPSSHPDGVSSLKFPSRSRPAGRR